ncbi:hypothetical protein TNCV_55851 [Trichonephila clavipes]|nr:hypothetical protein TNCV_55851 [Trichonephila clavipes]
MTWHLPSSSSSWMKTDDTGVREGKCNRETHRPQDIARGATPTQNRGSMGQGIRKPELKRQSEEWWHAGTSRKQKIRQNPSPSNSWPSSRMTSEVLLFATLQPSWQNSDRTVLQGLPGATGSKMANERLKWDLSYF